MSRSTCTYCGHDVGGHAGVKGCYGPSAAAHCPELRRSLDDQAAQTRAAEARQSPPQEKTPMGNHNIDCNFCGEDTRGLSGVRGCSTQAEADRCYTYKKTEERAATRPAPAPVVSQQAPEVQEARPPAEGGACPLVESAPAPTLAAPTGPTDLDLLAALVRGRSPSIQCSDGGVLVEFGDKVLASRLRNHLVCVRDGGEPDPSRRGTQHDRDRIRYLEECLATATRRAEAAETEVKVLGLRSCDDTNMLDWIEATARKSQTGISFDWVPPGQGGRSGFRFMRRFFVGEACDNLRAAIRSALGGVVQAERDDPKSTGQTRAELVTGLVAVAKNQVEYFRRKQAGLVPLEAGNSEDGLTHTPIGDYPAWEVGQANGRMSEATWWLGVLEEVQRGGSVPRNDLVPHGSSQDKGSRTYLGVLPQGEPYVAELQYHAEADAAEFYLVDDVAIYREVNPFLSTAHSLTSGAMVGFRIEDPRAWVRSILPTVEAETVPPDPVRPSREAVEPLARRIQTIAEKWRGSNGGIFTIRAMSLALARDLFGDWQLQRPTSPPAEPTGQEPAPPAPPASPALVRAVEQALRTYDTQRLQFGTTQETIDVMAPLVAARPDFVFSTGVGTTERVPLDQFTSLPTIPTQADYDAARALVEEAMDRAGETAFEHEARYAVVSGLVMRIAGLLGVGGPKFQEFERSLPPTASAQGPSAADRTVAARLRDTALAQELRFLGDDRSRAVAAMLRSDIADAVYTRALALVRGFAEERWVTTGNSDWYRGGPRGYVLRQEWRNQFGVTEWRDVTDDELRAIERR